jgi:hypothetical protein
MSLFNEKFLPIARKAVRKIKQTDEKSKKKWIYIGCGAAAVIFLLVYVIIEEGEMEDKISTFAKHGNLDSLEYYCIESRKYKKSRVLKGCEVVLAPIIAAEKEAEEKAWAARKKRQKLQRRR